MFANAIYVINIPRVFPYVLDPELDLAPAVFDRDNHRFRYVAALFKFYDISIGNADTDAYGEFSKDKAILHIFYIIATFVLTITIMNMLIGLMGDTLGTMNENRSGVQLMQQIDILYKHKFLLGMRKKSLKQRYIFKIKREPEQEEEGSGSADGAASSAEVVSEEIFNEKIDMISAEVANSTEKLTNLLEKNFKQVEESQHKYYMKNYKRIN